ncbi:MAG: DUF3089 domain-containing protein [Acidimicrobiales bacterium]
MDALAPVKWLCRPGMAHDPCESDLDSTVVTGSGRTRTVSASPAARPKIDCFYVYPTVSTQPTPNANLDLDPQETAVAVAQAARFSQVCNVYAPLYRQITLAVIAGTAHVTAADEALAYSDVLNAWKTYLADDNDGRGFAVIGHSQGAGILIKLLQNQVDDDPGVRARLVSAIILGGNVTVPVDRTVGGSFRHVPACTNVDAPGCVIAYSTFDQPPPSNTIFGRSDPSSGLQVVCVNPAASHADAAADTTVSATGAPASSSSSAARPPGARPLLPFFPTALSLDADASLSPPPSGTKVTTPWVTYPRLYSASCETDGHATWLQIDAHRRPGDTRPVVSQILGPTWGLHLDDVNLALGTLVDDLRQQAKAYVHSH